MDTILQFDHTVIFYIQQHFISSYLTPIMYWLSKITSAGALWILISIILMIQKKYRVIGLGMFISLVLVFIIGDQGLKPHVARLRPFVDFPEVPLVAPPPAATTYSFPSGHSFGSFAAATALYLGLSNICPTKRFWGVIALIGACVVSICTSILICTLSNRCINWISIRYYRRLHCMENRKSLMVLVDWS